MDKAKLRRDIDTAYGLLKNAVAALDGMEPSTLDVEDDSDILANLANYQFLMEFEQHLYDAWDDAAGTIATKKAWSTKDNPWAEQA